VTDAVLDVVAEDPQEEHVPAEMQPVTVHEDAAEQRQPDRNGSGLLRHFEWLAVDVDRLRRRQVGAGGDLVRDGAVAIREVRPLLAGASTLQEDEDPDVERDEREGHECRAVAALVLVADGEHRADDRAGSAP
jgi:hypothetical protein